MKKIKYGNRKNQHENKELDNLKQGDEICEAVLETLSDDYLNYINHLVKHSKTPVKNRSQNQVQAPSSDQEVVAKKEGNVRQQQRVVGEELKVRHHSQTGPKRPDYPPFKPSTQKNLTKQHEEQIPRKLSFQKQTIIARDKNIANKRRKKKMDGYPVQTVLKNQQKTMSFTRNNNPFQPSLAQKQREQITRQSREYQKILSRMQKRQKYYTNYQQSDTSNEKVSINDHIFNQGTSNRQSIYHPFINQIDNYLTHLESNPQSRMTSNYSFSRKSRGKYEKEYQPSRKSKNKYYGFNEEEYSEYDVQEILKENLKLNKKVKNYEQKIQELEDQVSTHLIQCKNRDKHYKNKVGELVKALTHSSSKITQQKRQINTMKTLLHSFGQKVKQIQHQQEDSQYVDEDISGSFIKYMGSHHHNHNHNHNETKSKYKRGLESTMPRHEEDRRYWEE